MWHRGMFLLRYDALDEFVGKYILPLVKEIIDIPEYEKYRDIVMFKNKNEMDIDIFAELLEANKSDDINSGKIAFLKEIGRASYILKGKDENTYDYSSIINEQGEAGMVLEIQKCPVCGMESLLLRCDFETDLEELCGDAGGYQCKEVVYRFESDIKCVNCSFQLNKFVGNLKDYGLHFNDFWKDYNILDD